jgi:uncharacterized protein YutE (UPF0331/DUF86 family)
MKKGLKGMELDRKLIQLRMDIIERNLKEIDEILKEEINYRNELALKHALLEIIEACFDIANHIISVLGLRRPLSYSDIFEVLKENKIINENLAKRLKEMAKFRNFLVHRYPFVQKEKLIEIAKYNLKDVKEFIKSILKFLKKFS